MATADFNFSCGDIKVEVGGQPFKVLADKVSIEWGATPPVDWAKLARVGRLAELFPPSSQSLSWTVKTAETPPGPEWVYDAEAHHCLAPEEVNRQGDVWLHELANQKWPEDPLHGSGWAYEWATCHDQMTPMCRAVGWDGEQTQACLWTRERTLLWVPCPVPGPLAALQWLMERKEAQGGADS